MDIQAKKVIQCDSCRQRMLPEENIEDEHIEAKLSNSLGEAVDMHFCSEICLLNKLQERNKTTKKKKSKASYYFNPINKVLEITP